MLAIALILIAATVALGFSVVASSTAADAILDVFGAGLGITVVGVTVVSSSPGQVQQGDQPGERRLQVLAAGRCGVAVGR